MTSNSTRESRLEIIGLINGCSSIEFRTRGWLTQLKFHFKRRDTLSREVNYDCYRVIATTNVRVTKQLMTKLIADNRHTLRFLEFLSTVSDHPEIKLYYKMLTLKQD